MLWMDILAIFFCLTVVAGCSLSDEELQLKFDRLERMIKAQYDNIQKQESTIRTLGESIEKQNQIAKKLTDEVQKQSETIEKQTLAIRQNLKTIQKLEENQTKQKHEINNFEEKAHRSVENDAQKYTLSRSIRQTEHVAFTVYLDHDETHLNNGQTIIFNQAVYNEGGHYNTRSGIFYCQQSGVYLFGVYLGVHSDKRAALKIVIEGANQVDTDAQGGGRDEQGANMVITHVTAGQSVWVSQYYENDGAVRGNPDYRFTTFSGVLLYTN